MSLNQLISPIGDGLDIKCHQIQQKTFQPQLINTGQELYSITSSNLLNQSMILIRTDVNPVTLTFPSNIDLLELLPNNGDYLQMTVKYRTSGVITVNSVDNLFFVFFNNSYELQSSDGVNWKTGTIGVGRPSYSGGSLRIF